MEVKGSENKKRKTEQNSKEQNRTDSRFQIPLLLVYSTLHNRKKEKGRWKKKGLLPAIDSSSPPLDPSSLSEMGER